MHRGVRVHVHVVDFCNNLKFVAHVDFILLMHKRFCKHLCVQF